MTMLAGYTPDTISSIIDSLCSNLERTHAWKVTGYSHIDIVFSLSQKTFLKSGNFLSIIIGFELQTFAGFHFPTYIILIHKLHLRLWGFMYTFLRRHKQRQEDTYIYICSTVLKISFILFRKNPILLPILYVMYVLPM